MRVAVGRNYVDAERSFRKGLALGPSPKALEVATYQLKALPAKDAQ